MSNNYFLGCVITSDQYDQQPLLKLVFKSYQFVRNEEICNDIHNFEQIKNAMNAEKFMFTGVLYDDITIIDTGDIDELNTDDKIVSFDVINYDEWISLFDTIIFGISEYRLYIEANDSWHDAMILFGTRNDTKKITYTIEEMKQICELLQKLKSDGRLINSDICLQKSK